jgi:hypothetical protein
MTTQIKQALAVIGGIAVVILQIVNVLQSVDIEKVMGTKANLMEQKAADIRTLVNQQTAILEKEIQGVKSTVLPSSTPTK